MTLAGSGRGGAASSSVVPYSSCRPSSCSASPRRWTSRTWMVEGRVSRPCCLLPWPWSTRALNPKGPFMALISTADSQFVSIWEVRRSTEGTRKKGLIRSGKLKKYTIAVDCSWKSLEVLTFGLVLSLIIFFFLIFLYIPFYIDTVIPRVTRHLLSNPVFSCITLAACMEIAVVAGFAAFLGKYLEQQFNLTTSSANQLLGRWIIILCEWRAVVPAVFYNQSVLPLKWKQTTFQLSPVAFPSGIVVGIVVKTTRSLMLAAVPGLFSGC